jgi:peptidoglycan/xylan/chitin deacetylase (PgdA/CDA1 family)
MILRRIGHKAKAALNTALCSFGMPYHHFLSAEKNIILMYHGVCKESNPYNRRHCYLADFEKQMRYLKKCANIISVEDFFEGRFDRGRSNVAITFDDGYLNNLTYALPVLERYGVKASVYVTGLFHSEEKIIWADFLQITTSFRQADFKLGEEKFEIRNKQAIRKKDGKSLLEIIKNEKPEYAYKQELYKVLGKDFSSVSSKTSEHWKLMNDEEILTLSRSPLISVGSHGWEHNNLGNIAPEQAREEIRHSKAYLENLIQKPVREIAFPDGSYSPAVLSHSRDLGFRCQLAAEHFSQPEDRNNPYLKKRYGIYQIGNWSEQIIFRQN